MEIKETIPASRKLQLGDAEGLLKGKSELVVCKGKKVDRFKKKDFGDGAERMLGPTGNLRAPTMIVGKVVVVGYSDDVYAEVLDAS